jgi:ADP-ribosylation factor-like protein 6
VVGLDNSGKTTLLNSLRLQRQAAHEVAPTVGFSVETFDRGNVRFTAMDMSGAGTYRSLWERYCPDASAVVFVVDASDKIRMAVARDELEALLAHPEMKKTAGRVPLLVFANKLDVPGGLLPADVSVMLGLPTVRDRAWQIQGCVALTGDGVEDGMLWLAAALDSVQSQDEKSNKEKAAAAAAGKGGAGAAAGAAGGAAKGK